MGKGNGTRMTLLVRIFGVCELLIFSQTVLKSYIFSILVLCLISCSDLIAQDFPRDTSYTLQSAYQKYVKNYPDIELVDQKLENEVTIQKDIVFKNTGQRNLQLDLYSPRQNSEIKPGVLIVHGGGWISGNKSMMKQISMRLASEGYVAVAVEYRLSPEAQYPAAIYDVKSALKWMRDHSEKYQINRDKIAIMGTSAGGQIAALVANTQNKSKFEDPADTSKASTTIQALIDIDGVLAFIHPVSEEGRVASLWLGGDQQEAQETWIEASALSHVNKDSPPTLFIGSAYPRFLAGREEMTVALNKHGIYNETHLLEQAPHSFWLFHPWFETTMEHVTSFLEVTLKNK
ncbi:alpha/beta hydrolase [Gracilimonas sp.]|uniref:alpha/beta hydrolase n=1 Tax=Gracilimonas sp. TaxID=1974203 RepID=UPI0032EC8089